MRIFIPQNAYKCVDNILKMRIIVHMKQKKLSTIVGKWASKIGPAEAKKRLIARNVKVTTADKLCDGRYPSEPRKKLAEILLEEMAKDGFTFAA